MEKIALITGGSRGIGAAVARRLASDGCDIWLNYRSNTQEAEKVKKEIEELGQKCLLVPFDVSDEESVEKALAPLLDEATPFILVNNAGITRDNVLGLMSSEEWDSVLKTSLYGFFNVTRMVIPKMQRKRAGRIVNISSTSGEIGLPGQVNYSSAKAGLLGATKALAKEVARRGILVNAVTPGFIETDMTEALPKDDIKKEIPLKRVGKAEDVAGAVSFLCSEDSSYITGQVVSVNGGLST